MTRRVITKQELLRMSINEYATFTMCVQARAYRLLGFNWTKQISWTVDPLTDDIEVTWE